LGVATFKQISFAGCSNRIAQSVIAPFGRSALIKTIYLYNKLFS